jgi:hypothetical protein
VRCLQLTISSITVVRQYAFVKALSRFHE